VLIVATDELHVVSGVPSNKSDVHYIRAKDKSVYNITFWGKAKGTLFFRGGE
jgi:hypothetical protein